MQTKRFGRFLLVVVICAAIFPAARPGRAEDPPALDRPGSLPAVPVGQLPTQEGAMDMIRVNQAGYYPHAAKRAVVAAESAAPLEWKLLDSRGQAVLSGQSKLYGYDQASGDQVQQIDFSAFSSVGTGFTLEAGGLHSTPFDIQPALYSQLKTDALRYFYLSRSGLELEEQYAGEAWARPAGHQSDRSVTCYTGYDNTGQRWPGCDYQLDASGGWYDAGDYGKYVVNGGIAVWTLLNAYERNPAAFGDGASTIPESQNGVPDILDEARWEMEFLLKMQIPDGQPQAGMVHHKIHGARWDPLPLLPPTSTDAGGPDGGRSLFPASTAATLNLAATAAQSARLWLTLDSAFAQRCLHAAETAWRAARANPDLPAALFSAGGGAYDDSSRADEFYWAAAELYLVTGKDEYRAYVLGSPEWARSTGLYWGDTAALGTISLALLESGLPGEKRAELRRSVISAADGFVETLEGQGYRVPLAADEYPWGSNSSVLNNALLMGLAHDFTGEERYLNGMAESMDYLLGRNPLGKSYISGYGADPLRNPHHRFWANQPEMGFPPPPPGVLAGGPNGRPEDPAAARAGLAGQPAAKCYIDHVDSYSTNEVAINWNAPLVWVTAYLEEKANGIGGPGADAAGLPDATAPGQTWHTLAWIALGAALVAAASWLWHRRRLRSKAKR